ncbi:MAG TPA: MFS transporter [Vineibacter sp.]|nr:MFS transporter [Vineibacter sp.]
MGLAPAAAEAITPTRGIVVSALGVAQILAWGSSFYLPAVLAKPIASDTQWPLSWIVGAVSIGLLISGLVAPRVGRLIDQTGGRPVLATSAALIAAGQIILAVSPNLLVYVAGWLVMGLGMGCGLYDAAFSTLGRLYGSAARGAITTLTLWGGFASTVCWPLSAWLVDLVGWRGTCLAYAGLHLTVVLPAYLLVLPRNPDAAQVDAGRGKPAESSLTRGRLLPAHRRTPVFALLAVILTAAGIIMSMWSIHLLTMLQAIGVPLAAAVALGALVGPSQVGSRIVEMLVGRYHHHPWWTQLASSTLVATGLAALALGVPVLAAALIVYGAGSGLSSIARGTLPLALFGSDGYATLMGKLAMPGLLAGAAAPTVGAILLEWIGAPGTLAVLATLAIGNLALVVILGLLVRRWAGKDRSEAT